MSAVRTVPGIIWVPVNDITTFKLHERIHVIDIRGEVVDGFVTETATKLEHGHMLCVSPDGEGGGTAHTTLGASFYREIGWT